MKIYKEPESRADGLAAFAEGGAQGGDTEGFELKYVVGGRDVVDVVGVGIGDPGVCASQGGAVGYRGAP